MTWVARYLPAKRAATSSSNIAWLCSKAAKSDSENSVENPDALRARVVE
jgi:hypothetical protein